MSIATARATLLAQVSGVSQISRAYDHEPKPGEITGPVGLTITLALMDAESYTFAVRLYVSLAGDVQSAWLAFDTLLPAVESALSATFGPLRWTGPTPTEDQSSLVAVCQCEVGREDF